MKLSPLTSILRQQVSLQLPLAVAWSPYMAHYPQSPHPVLFPRFLCQVPSSYDLVRRAWAAFCKLGAFCAKISREDCLPPRYYEKNLSLPFLYLSKHNMQAVLTQILKLALIAFCPFLELFLNGIKTRGNSQFWIVFRPFLLWFQQVWRRADAPSSAQKRLWDSIIMKGSGLIEKELRNIDVDSYPSKSHELKHPRNKDRALGIYGRPKAGLDVWIKVFLGSSELHRW